MKTDAGVEVQLHSFLTRKGLISSTFTNRFKVTVRWIYVFLGSFVQLRKLSISFVISVYLSVRLSVWNNSAPAIRNFLKFDIWVFLEKIFEKIKVWLKSNKNNGYFTRRRTYIFDFWFSEWEVLQKKVIENIKISILCLINFFWKIVSFMR